MSVNVHLEVYCYQQLTEKRMIKLVDNIWNFLTEVDKWTVIGSASITFLTIVLIRRMARKRNVMSRLRKKQKQLQEARSRLRDRVRTYPPLSH
uniref:Small integral membrane protein 15 n=1 Tax=Mesocestoides corti TaxID=53468 RepID=A0A5K3G1E1_MESCO